jgi:hypothetical protein
MSSWVVPCRYRVGVNRALLYWMILVGIVLRQQLLYKCWLRRSRHFEHEHRTTKNRRSSRRRRQRRRRRWRLSRIPGRNRSSLRSRTPSCRSNHSGSWLPRCKSGVAAVSRNRDRDDFSFLLPTQHRRQLLHRCHLIQSGKFLLQTFATFGTTFSFGLFGTFKVTT